MTLSKEFIEYMQTANPTVAEKLAAGFPDNLQANIDNKKIEVQRKTADALGEQFAKDASISAVETLASIDFMAKDIFIRDNMLKLAGMLLQSSTPEDIDQFLREYMYNELSFFPDKVDVTVNIVPIDVDEAKSSMGTQDLNIKDATGTINISYQGALIQIPFLIRDKEILPFDALQMGNETAVYNRQNLKNILFNLKNMATQTAPGAPVSRDGRNTVDSYIGVAKPLSTLTDSGFMSGMMQIQNTMGGMHGDLHTYGSVIEELLDKTAALSPEKKLPTMTDYFIQKHTIELETLAAQSDDAMEKTAEFDALLKSLVGNIQVFKNGEKFAFTERDNDVLGPTQAAVFEPLITLSNARVGNRLVVTSDGRFVILRPGERFYYNVDSTKEAADFQFKTRDIQSLNGDVLYTCSIGGLQTVPFLVSKVIDSASMGLEIQRIYRCKDLEGVPFTLISATNVADSELIIKNKTEIMQDLLAGTSQEKLTDYNLLLDKREPIVCLSMNARFIELARGPIQNVDSPDKAALLYDGNMKTAAIGDRLDIIESEDGRYTIAASWYDQKFRKPKTVVVQSIPEMRLKGMLKDIGYSYGEITSLMSRLKNEHEVSYDITSNISPWLIKPETTLVSSVQNAVANIKDALLNKETASKLVGDVAGGILGGVVGGTDAGDALIDFRKFAYESEALAEKLERVAMVNQSEGFSKLAGMMLVKHRIDDVIINTIDNDAQYDVNEILAELRKVTPYMEKIAYDLVDLKVTQALKRNTVLSPNVISATITHLDQLHKYANCM